MNVCDVLLRVLASADVDHIYGVPGDAINDLVDAIRRQDAIRFIQVRHEEAGALAASCEAKLTGKLAVCTGTAGPGALHLINGLMDAKRDHAPVLAITGQVDTRLLGGESHQEVDLDAIFDAACDFSEDIVDAAQAPRIIVEACRLALERGTVAHLGLPSNIASEKVNDDERWGVADTKASTSTPDEASLTRAVEILERAERPVILAGIGCRRCPSELEKFASLWKAPIIKALRGKDILPDEHPLVIGGLGLLGSKPAQQAISRCDVMLQVGSDFPYESFYPDQADVVQIDRVPHRLGRRHPVKVALSGDAGATLEQLHSRVTPVLARDSLELAQKEMKAWSEQMDEVELSEETPLRPQAVARMVGDLADDDAIFCCDTGTVTVWAARNLRIRGAQQFTLSGNLATMGFAMPGAIGASLAHPKRQVVALCGDGGFSMLMADFLTAVRYELPITCVIFNNRKLGLIQMEQEVAGYPESETELQEFDFAGFAELCGGQGRRADSREELEDALREGLASSKPCVIDAIVSPDEMTMPPRIELKQAMGYGLAKIKEALPWG